ncbi:MADF domain-containing protein [Aphelenchoides fujianensis]|nr:MADF domain-containing protein [Aphelenchoides fujianensis]
MVDRPPTFNELLIREVQLHPELYDSTYRVCTDNEERNLMWEMIARRIDQNVTGEFAKKRWLQMRDRYRKELKMALRNLTQPKWPYFEKLAWLDPYLKDSKSAGLNPLFLSASFDGVDGQTPAMALESLMKEDVSELHDFQQYANALENIMTASSSAFEQLHKRENGEALSPDSATSGITSASDDGEPQTTTVPLINSAASTAASEAGSSASGTSDASTNQQRGSSSPERPSGDEAVGGHEPVSMVEQLPMDAAGLLSASALAVDAENLSFVDSMLRGLNAASLVQSPIRPNVRQRNPPYLVRRGGGMKLKPDSGLSTPTTPVDRNRGLSAFRPLAKTMSVGGALNGLAARTPVQQPAACDRDAASLLEEWRAVEWSNDEDACFARLVVVRLRKFAAKEKRNIRARISDLLDQQEEAIE